MKLVIKAALTLCLLCAICAIALAQAQTDKPKAAVYIMGDPERSDALRVLVNNFLIKSGKYQMIAVDAIDVVAKEHKRQMSGAVSDADIAQLGQDAGAAYVCVVEQVKDKDDGSTIISTRMVVVQSKIAEFSEVARLNEDEDIINVVQGQIEKMLGIADGGVVVVPKSKSGAGVLSGNIMTDTRDGKKYRTVKIGGKVWVAENLNYSTGNSSCYKNDKSNCDKYGKLYDWNTAMKACPAGWHLPERAEWDDLVQEVGGKKVAGKKLKAKTGWKKNNGTDEFGFSALPGSWCIPGGPSGCFRSVGSSGGWWSATESNAINAYCLYMYSGNEKVDEYHTNKSYVHSVRCIQDD